MSINIDTKFEIANGVVTSTPLSPVELLQERLITWDITLVEYIEELSKLNKGDI